MAYRIFLSHSGTDKEWVKWIASNANNIGIHVYLYEHDPQPGTLIADKIKQAIQNSDALVVLLTRNSQFSPYVQQEIGFAEANRKRIIPLVQPGIQNQGLAMLEGREYIPFDFYNPQNALSTLLGYLQQLKKAKENEQAALMGLGALILLALALSGEQ
ncbi:MAG: toll/interleukin-1 receptor domain-containing protein [Candidatus Acidoferrales bacterium]